MKYIRYSLVSTKLPLCNLCHNKHRCPNFFLDTSSFHPQNDITNLNKTLTNFGCSSKARGERLRIYPGALGTRAFAKPGRFYFEVDVYLYVHHHLREDQIFEIGMAQVDEIDKKFTACACRYAWMMCVRMCPVCNTLCLQTWHDGKLLRHKSLKTHIQTGMKHVSKFGFLVNMEAGELQVVDAVNRLQFYRFKNVDVTRPLWPILGVFNSGRVNVSLTLRTGSEIDITKLYFKD
ncbi:hypothetical protein ACJMK2_017815 [Sinanodonta woodiana]|uniref:B30.2/SPRY domain-containing protein n=1 Tax=Sinanodonta woodiana TaxID=1069815 RepID=A0ABD3UBL5_SINWO